MNNPSVSAAYPDSKSHYEILDGLRGVAAIMVILMHLMETFSLGDHLHMFINHGYLAVDFFYVLSGFVIGYAYDDRWGSMDIGSFFKRRLIRLHPMILVGMAIGAALFYWSASPELFPPISGTPVWKVLLVMCIGFFLVPVPSSLEIRGWGEMFPLNGPAWSLFYEYIANIAYALFVRRFSNTVLAVLTFLAACVTVHFATTNANGDLVGGWSLEPAQLRVGVTRLIYPFLAGLLLSRVCKPGRIQNAFLWSSLLLMVVLAWPRIGGAEGLWLNGLYEAIVVIAVFPLIVYIGAGGTVQGKGATAIARFLGGISYPLYIIHYPLIYVYTAWVFDNKLPFSEAWHVGLLVLVSAIALAWASWRWYDIPVRKWLTRRFIK